MTNAWLELGRARVELGRTEEGVVAMKRALETSGGAPHVALAVAQSLRAAGRLEEAREHAQLALDAQPAEAHSVLAGIAFSAKDYIAAEREARAALEAGGRRLAGLMLLAKTLIYQKRPQEALQAIETAEAELAALPQGVANAQGIYLIRGDVQLALGNPEGAFRAYEREMRQFPDNPLGYVSAALILGTSRRPAEAIQVLRALVSANPNAPAAYRWAGATLLRIGARSEAATVIRLGVQRFPNDAELLALSQGKPIALEVPPLF
jgi:tetratricopeptide (TPR) repeat protein